MNADWRRTTWGELIELKYGKALRDYKDGTGEYPVFGTNGAVGSCDKALCPFPGIIIGRKGAYRGVHFSDKPFFVIDTAYYVNPKADFNVKWAYYHLLHQDINNLDSGSAIPSTSREDVYQLPAFVPPRRFQDHMVRVLDSFNSKIQLNHQINKTLEQMAHAIFKSWFVDFEPVKAKIAALEGGGSEEDALLAAMQTISGKDETELARFQAEQPEQYAELCATAELFPSAMQDSELGEIPEGWDCLALDEIAKYQNGLALQKYRPESEDDYLPVVKIAQLRKGYADGEEKASPNIKPDCIIDNGDVLFSWSGSLIVDIWCGGKAALNQHLFKVTSKKHPKWLYYQFTRHHLDEFQRIAAAKAVTMGHIKREHLKSALCSIPDERLVKRAEKTLGSILSQQIELRLQATTLFELREALLPKLLSGEITVSAVEDKLAEVAEPANV